MIESPRNQTLGALVLGGDVGALGMVRSLGRHNIPVWTLVGRYKLATLSRYSTRTFQWPSSNNVQEVDFLLELGLHHGLDGWVLFPIGDECAALVARNRDVLARQFRVTTPDWQIMRWAYDKRLTYQLAERLGLAYPDTRYPANREAVGALDCKFPVILKPAFKQSINRLTTDKAWLAKDRDELLKRYDEAVKLVDPSIIMVQELIIGGGESQFSYAGLFEDGKALASVAARRTRQYPVEFGWSSTFVETVEANELEVPATLLLRAMHYSGIAEVEFKRDHRDGKYKLLEINPRIWWWHSLANRAGVDLPYLLWRWVLNEPLEQVRARPGVKWVRMLRDIPAAATEIWRGGLSINAYRRSLGGSPEFAVFAKDDPLPALFEIPLWLASKCGDVRGAWPFRSLPSRRLGLPRSQRDE